MTTAGIMKRKLALALLVTLAILAFWAVPVFSQPQQFATENAAQLPAALFLNVEETKGRGPNENAARGINRAAAATSQRSGKVSISDNFLSPGQLAPGQSIRIDLFNAQAYNVVLDKTASAADTLTLSGQVEDSAFGTFHMSSTNGESMGILRLPEENKAYFLNYDSASGEHLLYEVALDEIDNLEGEPALLPSKHGIDRNLYNSPAAEEFSFDNVINGETEFTYTQTALNSPSEPATIDVMVVYTPAARNWAGGTTGMQNVINQSMSLAQDALNNSNTGITLNLVHTAEISYTESGDGGTDLVRLTGTSDGYMDTVHTLRNQYGADLVALFASVNYGGIGWLYEGYANEADYAFSITRVQQAAWTYTHIHEMGHNMGAHHHKQQNFQPGPNTSLNTYSAARRFQVGSTWYNTLMAYSDGSYYSAGAPGAGITSVEIGCFSSPSVTYYGVPTGHATEADNARTLRETKHAIAAYRARSVLANPASFSATAASSSQINLSWAKNTDNNNVMLVWSNNATFGTPVPGTSYSAGQSITGGGTVLYSGSNTGFNHTGLTQGTVYYYKAFSYNASNTYSSGVTATAATQLDPVSVYPWTETFEDNSTSRLGWTQQYITGTNQWTIATGSNGGTILSAYQGTRNARFTSTAGGPYVSKLISPVLDLSGVNNPALSFWYGQQAWSGDQNELKVYYRTSPSAGWVQIFHDTENRSSWTNQELALPSPSATYQLAFEGFDKWGYANVIDNVSVYSVDPPEAPVLSSPEEGATFQTTAIEFSWQAVDGATGYQLDVSRSADFALGSMVFSEDVGNITSKIVNAEFTEGTYYWRVRAYSQGGNSDWSGVRSFNSSNVNRLIGADDIIATNALGSNHIVLTGFTATASGELSELRVKCSAVGNVKVGVYSDINGTPGVLLAANQVGQAVGPGWNTVTLGEPIIFEEGIFYWLAVNSSAPIISSRYQSGLSGIRYCFKALSYGSDLPATAVGGFTYATGYYTIIQGWGGPPFE